MNAKEVISIIQDMNYNYHSDGPSIVGKIQKKCIKLKMASLTKRDKDIGAIASELDSFEANLYSNPNMFPNRDHSDIKDVNAYFTASKQEFFNNLDLDNNRTMSM